VGTQPSAPVGFGDASALVLAARALGLLDGTMTLVERLGDQPEGSMECLRLELDAKREQAELIVVEPVQGILGDSSAIDRHALPHTVNPRRLGRCSQDTGGVSAVIPHLAPVR
jgi:hypothetical protein